MAEVHLSFSPFPSKPQSYSSSGATYDSIEGQFRRIRKGAKELKAKVESGEIPTAPSRGARTNPTTPRKPPSTPKDRIAGGRVCKSVNGTPTKKSGSFCRSIKQEAESSASSFYDSKSQVEVQTEADVQDVEDWRAATEQAGYSGHGSRSAQGGGEGGEFEFLWAEEQMEEGV